MTTPDLLCPHCDWSVKVVRELREVPLGSRRVTIEDEWSRCDECDEDFYTTEQADRRHRFAIEKARADDGLLPPGEIRRIREELGFTQQRFEQLLGVGEKTVVRWEQGRVCQNQATDRLIRLAAALPENVRMLAAINGVSLDAHSEPRAVKKPLMHRRFRTAQNLVRLSGTSEKPTSSVDRLSTQGSLRKRSASGGSGY